MVGLRYLKNRSSILFWYTLALALYGLDLASAVFIVHLGDSLTWATRLALYLSSIYFLLALRAANRRGKYLSVSPTDGPMRSGATQTDRLPFINMRNSLLYGKLVMNGEGKPVDAVLLDVNQAFEKEMGSGKMTS